MDFWNPVHALFRDDDHFYHVDTQYPREYLMRTDESNAYGKEALMKIREILLALVPKNFTATQQKEKWIGDNVYGRIITH